MDMRLLISLKAILSVFIVCYAVASFGFSQKVTDDLGTTLYLNRPAKRIVSLAPDITEILFAIGAGEKVVGVIKGSDYPQSAKKIPVVGSYLGLDLEKILSLHPDLIVTWGNTFNRQLKVLKNLGIPVYTTVPKQLDDIPHTMQNLGQLTNTSALAIAAAEHFSQELSLLKMQYQAQKSVTVFYQIGSYSLITINKDSWINQVITLCGGRNVFADAKLIAPEITWEAVVTANPDVIISGTTDANWQQRWANWPQISAVKQHRLFTIHPDLIDRAGPRLLQGARQLCKQLASAR